MHLKVHSRGKSSVKDTGVPWSGAHKYCVRCKQIMSVPDKTEYALVCILNQRHRYAFVRCTQMSDKLCASESPCLLA